MALEDLDENSGQDDKDNENDEGAESPEVVEVEAEEVEPAGPDTGGVIKPVDELDNIAETYDRFEEIKQDLLEDEDLQRVGGTPFITKSGWRKIATAFNVSVTVVDDETWIEDGVVKAKVTAEAEAPNGKSATAVGMCASNESNFMTKLEEDTKIALDEVSDKYGGFDEEEILLVDGAWRGLHRPREVKEHDLYGTAATRAKNRAISDCVGGGEVSAEEVSRSKEDVFGE